MQIREWQEKAKEQLRQLFARLSRRRPQTERLPGVPPLPGTSLSRVGGRLATFRLPRIDWEKLYRKSFLYNSVLALICGYFAADLLVAALSPWFPAVQPPLARLNLASNRQNFMAYTNIFMPKGHPNLFNEKGLVPDNDEGGGDENGQPVKTSLPLTLLGVIVVSDFQKSVASVEDKGQNQVLAVRVGEPISANTVVETIFSDSVVFINHNTHRREFIDLPQDEITASLHAAPAAGAGIQQTDSTHFKIERKEVDKAMENLSNVLNDARCVPEMENGRPVGFRCFQINPGSVYDKLGIKDNDVICGINGEALTDASKTLQMLSSLKDPSTRKIQICVKRNGQIANYSYELN